MALLQWSLVLMNVSPLIVATRSHLGYHVISVTPQETNQLHRLSQHLRQEATNGHVDIWTLPRESGRSVVFKVPEDYEISTEAWLNGENISYHVITDIIESLMREESTEQPRTFRRSISNKSTDNIDLNQYVDHDGMNRYLREIVNICDICRLFDLGTSYEGREMLAIKIGRKTRYKSAVWIDAGIHAREWITPAIALNIIKKLVDGYYGNDSDVTPMLDRFVWYILPSVNPDGYMFSRQYDRLWRKSRGLTRRFGCRGTDLNRNWDIHWAESGVSFSRCSEIFPGEFPFSEVEARNIRRFLWLRRKEFLVYLSLHSYGQYWLYPWGCNESLPDDWKELDRVSQRIVRKILKTSGVWYETGSSSGMLYSASGLSHDWAKGVARIQYSYTVELPDQGEYGFFLPSDQILPTFEDFWPALVEMSEAILERTEGGTD